MRKLSELGEKYSHDLSKLKFEEFLNHPINHTENFGDGGKTLLKKLKFLKKLKESVYMGRYYLK